MDLWEATAGTSVALVFTTQLHKYASRVGNTPGSKTSLVLPNNLPLPRFTSHIMSHTTQAYSFTINNQSGSDQSYAIFAQAPRESLVRLRQWRTW